MAVVQQPPTTNHSYDVMLVLDINQHVTLLTAPFWLWHTTDLVSGASAVGASTYNVHHHDRNDSDGTAQFGLIPLARLLNRVVAPTIDV